MKFKKKNLTESKIILSLVLILTLILSYSAPILADDSPDSGADSSSDDSPSDDGGTDDSIDDSSDDSPSDDNGLDDSSDDSSDDSPLDDNGLDDNVTGNDSSSGGSSSSSYNDDNGSASLRDLQEMNSGTSSDDSLDDSSDDSSDDSYDDSPDGSYDDSPDDSYDDNSSGRNKRVNAIDAKIKKLEVSKENAFSTQARNEIEAQIRKLEIQRERVQDIDHMADDARDVSSGSVAAMIANVKASRNVSREMEGYKYTNKVVASRGEVSTPQKNAINNFIVYGTQTTGSLGEGERAGVLDSYAAAYGHLPSTVSEWEDVMKIANGRWPSEAATNAIDDASKEFKRIYQREPDLSDSNDNAAVTVMAYGLRPAHRNIESEKSAIKIYKSIFRKNPATATDWDVVRAIAYSGATR